ncbi:hypothetical protein [Jiangella mangrovi]|uniref:hypothetical protein n=1 Tax=Jiangella mangrovi TaxID=1524084 RepID=UPI0016181285|nr:hypothetical protein [Jiangella mangrovi]
MLIMEKGGSKRDRKPTFSMINSERPAELDHSETNGRTPQRNRQRPAQRKNSGSEGRVHSGEGALVL